MVIKKNCCVRFFNSKINFSQIKFETVTGYEFSLETDEAIGSDGGTYRVVLSTDTNAVESSCTVTVLGSEVTPVFRRGLQDQSVPKGSKLVLEVSSFIL